VRGSEVEVEGEAGEQVGEVETDEVA